jgi:hypothetical protein
MDWKDYVIIGGALFLLFGGGLYTHYKRKGEGQVQSGPAGDAFFIDDLRRVGTAITTVGGRAIQEGAKLKRDGAMAYSNRQQRGQLHLVGGG